MAWSRWEEASGFEFTDIIYEKKHLEAGGGVARITFNRPQERNAIRAITVEEVRRAIRDVNNDPLVGVLVITGAGDEFSSDGELDEVDPTELGSAASANDYVRRCKKPVIAAVKGECIGDGNHLAYCCDLTIAADNSIFGQNSARVGSIREGWIPIYSSRVVRAKRAKEMWMLCRRFNAQDALKMGLVNRIVPLEQLDDEVDKWCKELLSMSPTALEVLKYVFDYDLDATVPAGDDIKDFALAGYLKSEEYEEGRRAFAEGRKPTYWQFRKPRA